MTTIVECPREKKNPTRYWAFAGLHQLPGHIVDGGDVISVNCIAKTESIKPEERFVDRSKEQSTIYQLEPIATRLLLQLIDGPIPVLIRHQWIFL